MVLSSSCLSYFSDGNVKLKVRGSHIGQLCCMRLTKRRARNLHKAALATAILGSDLSPSDNAEHQRAQEPAREQPTEGMATQRWSGATASLGLSLAKQAISISARRTMLEQRSADRQMLLMDSPARLSTTIMAVWFCSAGVHFKGDRPTAGLVKYSLEAHCWG